jgi:hypothetical protein
VDRLEAAGLILPILLLVAFFWILFLGHLIRALVSILVP